MPDSAARSLFGSRLPSLDGWRAASILLVLGGHCSGIAGFPKQYAAAFNLAFNGDLGVRCFFLISGFLITWLLLLEQRQSGRVNLKRFYIRRSLRILPVYFAYLAALAALQAFTPYSQSALQWAGNLTFTTNYLGGTWTSGHLWSLAVEEQFYLVWPLSLVLFGLAFNPRRALQVFCAVLVVSALHRAIAYSYSHAHVAVMAYSPYSLLNYMDSLAVGCACAILLHRKPDFVQRILTAHPLRAALVALALFLTPYVLRHLLLLGVFTVPLGTILEALGLGILMLQSLFIPDRWPYRILNWRWVIQIGVLSYSLYIWQEIFCTKPEIFGLQQVWWMSFPGWLVPTFAVAFISYYGLERPLFALRSRFR